MAGRSGSYSVTGRLGDVWARGSRLKGNVADAVIGGAVAFSTDELSTLTLSIVDDDDFTLARTGLFDPGTPTTAGSRVEYRGRKFECRAVELAPRGRDNLLTVTARSLVGSRMRRQSGAKVHKGMSPTEFLAGDVKTAGARFVGQPSAGRKNVGRHKDENTYTCGQRLADELGYVFFEANDTVYFGKPTWLIEHTARLPVRWRGPRTDDSIDAMPACRRSGDDAKRLATVEAALRGDLGEDALPGMCLALTGIPLFEGADYMVSRVTIPLADRAPVTVSAETAINPTPHPPIKVHVHAGGPGNGGSVSTSGTATASGQGTARAFLAYAMSQMGDTYIYGAEASPSDPDPNAFDCSELVQWAAARAGVAFVDGSSAQIAAAHPVSLETAIRTPGALLWHPGHIAISQGNGRTVEAANPSVGVTSYNAAGRFARGGLVPGLRY